MEPPAIEALDLRKTWRTGWGKEARALDNFSLIVPRGVCFGLVGPAGAGKSTFARIAASQTRASGGMIRVFGEPPRKGRVPFTSAAERSAAEVLVSLNQRATQGRFHWTRALGFLRAPAESPGLVILDDAGGLDPACLGEAIRVVRYLTGRGSTVLFCSRPSPVVARLCSRVAMVRAGRVAAAGTVEQVLGACGFRLTVAGLPDQLQEVLAQDGLTIGFNGAGYWIESGDRARLNPTIDRIRAAGGSIESLEDLPAL